MAVRSQFERGEILQNRELVILLENLKIYSHRCSLGYDRDSH